MRLSSVLAFIFDIDGTLVDSNELHVDSWDRAFRRFGKQFPREQLRAQIGKGSDQYLPEFLTPEEIKRFSKELDEYRSEIFRKEYLPKVRSFPKVCELFQRIHDDNKRIVLASSGKRLTPSITLTCLRSAISLRATCRVTMPTVPNRRPISLPRRWKRLAAFRLPTL
jgi:phosphoglycolate phosphatase-like HAD superfamily hydrolase